MARIVVERIDADPTLFNVARENLERWRRLHGTLSRANEEWEQILNRPWSEIRAILLDASNEGQRLRSTHPFRGIVTEAERLAIVARHPPPWPFVPYGPAGDPVRRDVLAHYDDNRDGRITCKEARRHEIAPFVQHAGQTKHIRFQRQRHYGDKTVTMRRNRGMFAMDFNAIREMPDKEQLSWLATSM